MSQAIPVRRSSGQARRPPRPRRASAGLSSTRAAGALTMVACALAIYGVSASQAFVFKRLDIDPVGRVVATDSAIRERLGLQVGGSNLFLVATDTLEARLLELPSVLSADVVVRLPDTVGVHVREREPILAWVVGTRRLLVDREGVVFAEEAADDAGPHAELPAVGDERASAAGLAVGGRLDPVDLDAASRLGSLRPVDIGTSALGLVLTVDDEDGFSMRPNKGPWTAVFGFYTPSLRPPSMVPGQVQALRSLLLERGEAAVRRVVLANPRGGTFLPRVPPTPSSSSTPSTSSNLSASPRPTP